MVNLIIVSVYLTMLILLTITMLILEAITMLMLSTIINRLVILLMLDSSLFCLNYSLKKLFYSIAHVL